MKHRYVLRQRLWYLLFLLLGGLLRIIALQGELWFDEVWAFNVAHTVQHIPDFFSSKVFDGHSSLSLLWLRVLSQDASSFLCRIPFFLSSLIFLPASFWSLSERPFEERRLFLFFGTTSFLLGLYGTEARGYSFLLTGSILAYGALKRLHQQDSLGMKLLFWGSSLIAFFSHYSFLQFEAVAFIWSYFSFRRFFPFITAVKRTLSLHWFPLTVVSGAFLAYVRLLPSGDAPHVPFLSIFINLFSSLIGGPLYTYGGNAEEGALLAAAGVLFLLGSSLYSMRKTHNEELPFLIGMLIVMPILTLIVKRPVVLVERYFLLSGLFAYRVLAASLSTFPFRLGKAILLGGYILGTCWWWTNFSLFYRGQTLGVLRELGIRQLAVAIDNPLELAPYLEKLGENSPVIREDALWYLSVNYRPLNVFPDRLERNGSIFLRIREGRCIGFSCEGWALYEKKEPKLS